MRRAATLPNSLEGHALQLTPNVTPWGVRTQAPFHSVRTSRDRRVF